MCPPVRVTVILDRGTASQCVNNKWQRHWHGKRRRPTPTAGKASSPWDPHGPHRGIAWPTGDRGMSHGGSALGLSWRSGPPCPVHSANFHCGHLLQDSVPASLQVRSEETPLPGADPGPWAPLQDTPCLAVSPPALPAWSLSCARGHPHQGPLCLRLLEKIVLCLRPASSVPVTTHLPGVALSPDCAQPSTILRATSSWWPSEL